MTIFTLRYNIYLWLRRFFGRLFHGGISEVDLWSVDTFLAKKIAKTIKRFVEMKRHGVPAMLLDDMSDNADDYTEIWDAILWKMIDGFEMIASKDFYDTPDYDYIDETMELFSSFFMSIWD